MARKTPLITVMENAARKAARKLLRDFNEVENLQVSRKGPADFVSNADVGAEKLIREELEYARPDFGFKLEEGGEIPAKDGKSYWVIDPLDGTTNFLHGMPHFAISIALMEGKEILAGLILDPVKDELFWAAKGEGAFVNNQRLRVSGRNRMADCVFATGIPFLGKPGHETFLREAHEIMAVSAGIRRFGAASLDLAYVAAGRFDGYWERGLSAWDLAAGIIIVREAGGFVTQIDGGERMLEKGDILASNSEINSQMSEALRRARKK
ncbi:inositol monophosphatase [Sneathiella sp. P13V-1]|uniref:inositol monophosphatase family protein n=1 Tax=Sneathiella sp. P13V-1 TaxID=2697366 RepID=UPI00187B5A3D|nr:inositol monophosphatase family protein [Sneathiella sp. P13V-1]MBE7637988.1 inositol monophosphatase [Sneathiella sp. P13V-1]